ncbi:ATP-binding protein [Kiloniella antarctica]|uniref:histidine kinase n=1 Tax=Kiloniella antarctica TaxID=1550907 RepID=A0ABW5BQ85_9PROT
MVVLIATASFVSLNSFNDLRKGLSDFTGNDLPKVVAGSKLNQISANLASFAPALLASNSKGTRQAVLLRLKDQVAWFDEILKKLGMAGHSSEDLQRFVRLKSTLVDNLHNIAELVRKRSLNSSAAKTVLQKTPELNAQLFEFNKTLFAHKEIKSSAIQSWSGSFAAGLLLIPTAAATDDPLVLQKINAQFKLYLKEITDYSTQLPLDTQEKAEFLLEQLDILGLGATGIIELREQAFLLDDIVQGTVSQNKVVADRFVASASILTRKLQQGILDRSLELDRESEERSVLFLLMSLLSFIGAILAFLYINRSVIQRLTNLNHTMISHASGLRTPIVTSGNDEITDMTKAFKFFVDASDKREGDLRDAREQAEKADKAKSRFLAAASHDLRQPLHAIGLFVATLLGRRHDEKAKPIVKNIERSIDHMNDLFESILDYSQLEAGELRPELSSFELSPLLEMLERDFLVLAQEKGLTLEVEKTSVWIKTEPLMFDRILRNLISNAIRYTQNGYVRIRLEDITENVVNIVVDDTGRGIALNKQEKIFQEFYRSGIKKEKGLGLGLAIAQQMALLLGTKILLSSAINEGSKFSLKVTKVKSELEDQGREFQNNHITGQNLLENELVIVLDDDTQILKAMRGLLEKWGCQVVAVPSKEALFRELANNIRQPLAYIVDYQLDRNETGVDILENFLEKDEVLRGIIVSGNTDPLVELQVKEAGFVFFSKPLRPARIAAYLRHLAREKEVA